MNPLLQKIKAVIETREQEITRLNATVSRLAQELNKCTLDKEALENVVSEIEQYLAKFSNPETTSETETE